MKSKKDIIMTKIEIELPDLTFFKYTGEYRLPDPREWYLSPENGMPTRADRDALRNLDRQIIMKEVLRPSERLSKFLCVQDFKVESEFELLEIIEDIKKLEEECQLAGVDHD